MKTYLALISTAVLALSACSQEPAQPAEASATASAASVVSSEAPAADTASETVAAAATDAACEVVVESTDQMTFNTKEIALNKACKEVKLTLKHTGTMPLSSMGHNVVISDSKDVDAVLADGAKALIDNNFVKPNDERVLAFTKLIGGGEEVSINIDTAKFTAGGNYEFYCTFPGHSGLMRGKVVVS